MDRGGGGGRGLLVVVNSKHPFDGCSKSILSIETQMYNV